jgi:hypothetical protein
MDTLKDKQNLEMLLERGNGPWRVWVRADEERALAEDLS